jgi:hypothetical protein
MSVHYYKAIYLWSVMYKFIVNTNNERQPLNRLIVLSKNRHRDVLARSMVPFFALIAKYHCFIPSVWLDG